MNRSWFKKSFLLSLVFFVALGGFSCKKGTGDTKPGNVDNNKNKGIKIGSFKIKDKEYKIWQLDLDKDKVMVVELPYGLESFTKNDVTNIKAKDLELELDRIEPETVTPGDVGMGFTIITKANATTKATSRSFKAVKGKKVLPRYKVTYETDPKGAGNIFVSFVEGGRTIPPDDMVDEGSNLYFDLSVLNDSYDSEDFEWIGAKVPDPTKPRRAEVLDIKSNVHVVAKLKRKIITLVLNSILLDGKPAIRSQADENQYIFVADEGVSEIKEIKVKYDGEVKDGKPKEKIEGITLPYTITNEPKVVTISVEGDEIYNPMPPVTLKIYKSKTLVLDSITVNDNNLPLTVKDNKIEEDQKINADSITSAKAKFIGIKDEITLTVTGGAITAEGTEITFTAKKDGYDDWEQKVKIKKK